MPLSYRDAERELFDPANDPVLKPGFVSEQYQATPAQLEHGRRRLAERRAWWRWTRVQQDSAEAARLRGAFDSERGEAIAQRRAAARRETTPGERQERRRVAARQRIVRRRVLGDLEAGRVWFRPLPWLDTGMLIHCDAPDPLRLAVTTAVPLVVELTGFSAPIHEMNAKTPIRLSTELAEEYLQFFCEHVHGDHGGFHPIEEEFSEITDPDDPGRFYLRASDLREGPELASRRAAPDGGRSGGRSFPRATLAWPITVLDLTESTWTMATSIVYAGNAFRAVFKVYSNGAVEMLDDRYIDNAALQGPALQWKPRPAGE